MPKYFTTKKSLTARVSNGVLRPITLHAGMDCPFLRGEGVRVEDVAGRTTKKCSYCFG